MASGNSPDEEFSVPRLLREFGIETFGTMKAFAKALGMTAPALQGYLNGSRTPGKRVLAKLSDLGFDLSKLDNSPNEEFRGVVGVRPSVRKREEVGSPRLAIGAAQRILRLPIEEISAQIDASPEEMQSWAAGSAAPSSRQLSQLFNLVAIAGAARCGGDVTPEAIPDLLQANSGR